MDFALSSVKGFSFQTQLKSEIDTPVFIAQIDAAWVNEEFKFPQ